MDWTVYPKTRIARLPKVLWPAALVVRNITKKSSPSYVYEADGLATEHFSPFLADDEFNRLYWDVEEDWIPNYQGDFRWRMWLLTRMARHCSSLPGDFAEFGVYRAGATKLVLSTTDLGTRRIHLFDTFAGIPASQLSAQEADFAGRLADTSVEHVRKFLAPWIDRVCIHQGDVFETVPSGDLEALAYVHLDLNGAASTIHVLEHVYPLLVVGAMVIFDDYGWEEFGEQRLAIDEFFSARKEEVLALPTGQGVVIKQAAD